MVKVFIQVQNRNMAIEMQHPLNDQSQKLVGSPLKFSDTPVSYDHAPPTCGQHTDEVLKRDLELTEEEIIQLRNESVIG